MVLRSRRRRAAIRVAALAALALVSAGCTDDDGDTTGATGEETGAAGAVDVTVQEFAVIPASSSAPAGDATFNVTNKGPDDVHEFVVFQTDLAPDALPTNEDGTVNEEGEGVELQGEIEDVAVGDPEPDRRSPGRLLRLHLQHLRGGGAGGALPGALPGRDAGAFTVE